MFGHSVLRFVFSLIMALIVFAPSTSQANAVPLELNCATPPNSLDSGNPAWISDWNPYPLTVYTKASYSASHTEDIPVRESVIILSTPVCYQGDIWVQIQHGNNTGWAVAINRDGSYNLVPNGHEVNPSLDSCPLLTAAFLPGDTVWISDFNFRALTMYANASYNAFHIVDIPIRETVTLVSKHICYQGDAWIKIQYGNNTGWVVAVNRDSSFNLVPVHVAGLNETP